MANNNSSNDSNDIVGTWVLQILKSTDSADRNEQQIEEVREKLVNHLRNQKAVVRLESLHVGKNELEDIKENMASITLPTINREISSTSLNGIKYCSSHYAFEIKENTYPDCTIKLFLNCEKCEKQTAYSIAVKEYETMSKQNYKKSKITLPPLKSIKTPAKQCIKDSELSSLKRPLDNDAVSEHLSKRNNITNDYQSSNSHIQQPSNINNDIASHGNNARVIKPKPLQQQTTSTCTNFENTSEYDSSKNNNVTSLTSNCDFGYSATSTTVLNESSQFESNAENFIEYKFIHITNNFQVASTNETVEVEDALSYSFVNIFNELSTSTSDNSPQAKLPIHIKKNLVYSKSVTEYINENLSMSNTNCKSSTSHQNRNEEMTSDVNDLSKVVINCSNCVVQQPLTTEIVDATMQSNAIEPPLDMPLLDLNEKYFDNLPANTTLVIHDDSTLCSNEITLTADNNTCSNQCEDLLTSSESLIDDLLKSLNLIQPEPIQDDYSLTDINEILNNMLSKEIVANPRQIIANEESSISEIENAHKSPNNELNTNKTKSIASSIEVSSSVINHFTNCPNDDESIYNDCGSNDKFYDELCSTKCSTETVSYKMPKLQNTENKYIINDKQRPSDVQEDTAIGTLNNNKNDTISFTLEVRPPLPNNQNYKNITQIISNELIAEPLIAEVQQNPQELTQQCASISTINKNDITSSTTKMLAKNTLPSSSSNQKYENITRTISNELVKKSTTAEIQQNLEKPITQQSSITEPLAKNTLPSSLNNQKCGNIIRNELIVESVSAEIDQQLQQPSNQQIDEILLNCSKMHYNHTIMNNVKDIFGVTCLSYLKRQCTANVNCPLSHRFNSDDLVIKILQNLSSTFLKSVYRFMISNKSLYHMYFKCFTHFYSSQNNRLKLLNMVYDCERYEEYSSKLITIYDALVSCGLSKVNACHLILKRLEHCTSTVIINELVIIIINADWTMFTEYLNRLTHDSVQYTFSIDILEQMAHDIIARPHPQLLRNLVGYAQKAQGKDFNRLMQSEVLLNCIQLFTSGTDSL